MKGRLSEDEL